jgi:hypothetical protein
MGFSEALVGSEPRDFRINGTNAVVLSIIGTHRR